LLPNIKTRQFINKDLPAVYSLIQNTIDFCYSGIYPEEAIEFFKKYHNHNNILNDTAAGYTIVVESNRQIIGTGTLLDTNIRRVFVDPAHQQRGIGKLITQELEQKASLKKLASLDLQSSIVSREFWESMGYIVQEEYYIPVQNNQKLRFYEMTKTLSG
jgi:citrate lyase synthetase